MSLFDGIAQEDLESKNFSDLPEGDYNCEITNSSLDTTKDPVRISIECTIIHGEHEKRKMWVNLNMGEKGKLYVGQFLHQFDINIFDIETIEELGETFFALRGAEVVTHLKYTKDKNDPNKTYKNVYLNEVVSCDGQSKVDTPLNAGGIEDPKFDEKDEFGF